MWCKRGFTNLLTAWVVYWFLHYDPLSVWSAVGLFMLLQRSLLKPIRHKRSCMRLITLSITLAKVLIVPRRIIWSWYTGRWWVGWYNEDRSPPRPLLTVPNVTPQPSVASVPITVLLYNGSLLCSFNVPVKGLIQRRGFSVGLNVCFCLQLCIHCNGFTDLRLNCTTHSFRHWSY